ncbi:MAG TPA: D-glycero-beta-D-manno-heptose-7-phosphate kinase [Terriglobales bacterium]|nr:D-glycero-beta-D-manno-heptose-7-phosphate kinase [Terriglobales bacterium]
MEIANSEYSMDGRQGLISILEQFCNVHLLVLGDLMLDRFIWGDVDRISPEAPVPVLRVASESSRLGGAANVIHNVCALGGKVTACGVIGQDAPGKKLMQDLRRIRASTAGVFADSELQTIQKTRIIARPRQQQIVRLDRENHNILAQPILKKIRDFVYDQMSRCDGLVVSDYGKGVVHAELLGALGESARKGSIRVIVDPKQENYSRYRRPTLITPNKDEASGASGIAIRDEKTLRMAGEKLLRLWQAKAVLITRGPEGMSLFRPRHPVQHFPTEAREIFDVTGAGDTVVAVCALALAAGANYGEAAVIANFAARLVGEEVGTVAVPLPKLIRVIEEAS